MIAERRDAPRRTVAEVLWRLLQMTLLPALAVWMVQRRAGRSATKGSLVYESYRRMSLLTEDGKLYLIAGDHEPLNKELAPLAVKTVTLHGNLAGRQGMNLINNAEIVKE